MLIVHTSTTLFNCSCEKVQAWNEHVRVTASSDLGRCGLFFHSTNSSKLLFYVVLMQARGHFSQSMTPVAHSVDRQLLHFNGMLQ